MYRRLKTTRMFLLVFLGCFILASCVRMKPTERPALSFLRVENGRTVDVTGKPVVLKGCNLGNWLVLEMWMLDTKDAADQYDFESILRQRFGVEKANALMDLYRTNWITAHDFEIVPSFGFNTIRLPFNYTLLMDPDHPMELKRDAFKWLDAAVRMAKENGLYVILDMHGVPGGQSVDHSTGHKDQNKLWDSAEYQKQTVWLWKKIAEHFKDEPAVAAYEPMNEPFGDYQTNRHEDTLVRLMGEIYTAIRSVDGRHIIVLAGTQSGIGCYGAPSARGWSNVMLTEHYYPGVLGGSPNLEAHRYLINRNLPYIENLLHTMSVPMLVGEFNVVFQKAGGPMLMRQYYDLYAAKGWWATMWCYKTISRGGGVGKDNWYMVTNEEEAPPFSVRTSSYGELEAFFKWLGTAKYSAFEELRRALTTPNPSHLFLEDPPYPMTAPFQDSAVDWQSTDIACRPAGGQKVLSGSAIDVYGGGRDIWNAHDEFHFVWRSMTNDFVLTATIESLDEVNPYGKAGLMIRGGLEADAPHVLLHVFPSGQVDLGWRDKKGAAMQEKKFTILQFPLYLKLKKSTNRIDAAYSVDGQNWKDAGSFTFDWAGGACCAGMAVLSHDDRYLARGAFRDINIQKGE